MKRLLPLHLGLLAGCLAGLVAHRLQPVPMVVTARVAPPVEAVTVLPREGVVRVWDATTGQQVGEFPLADPHDDCPSPSYAGEVLLRTNLRGRDLRGGDFTNTLLRGVDFSGARLDDARFDDDAFDAACRWPAGFDPEDHGAVPRQEHGLPAIGRGLFQIGGLDLLISLAMFAGVVSSALLIGAYLVVSLGGTVLLLLRMPRYLR